MKYLCLIAISCFVMEAAAQKKWEGFEIVEKPAGKRVDILYNGRLLTAYRYDDSVFKPFLYPVNTVDGITVTRGYPLEPRKGDRSDHPHHVGVWLNYESVNGLDFWNNSTAIEPARRNAYGTILHTAIEAKEAHKDKASLVVRAKWVRPNGQLVLNERTTYKFSVVNNDFIIDRTTTLTADKDSVKFKDVKDGLFAIRVARELEQPSTEKSEYIDEHGNKTEVPALPTSGITGRYTSSNGLTGDSVWSTQGTWVMLQGIKDNKPITIGIFDHPGNPGYPAYWHARGYGLFSVNPLGRAIFSNGKERLNLSLAPGQSTQFRYTLLVSSGKNISPADMEKIAKQVN
ncbi:PmoA family protein [Flavihumibacter fluvii]|uniref:DUF6807 domain-containing protein n=1 Tax=Flavihumibacter fluvii TaxID=2838157 RepID=UPI001BDDE28D|nr:PmoA family protein [Flavihumibacter fluvii]ULQ54088.1 PmoA family protein [Flavihumibacter fluvii]